MIDLQELCYKLSIKLQHVLYQQVDVALLMEYFSDEQSVKLKVNTLDMLRETHDIIYHIRSYNYITRNDIFFVV